MSDGLFQPKDSEPPEPRSKLKRLIAWSLRPFRKPWLIRLALNIGPLILRVFVLLREHWPNSG